MAGEPCSTSWKAAGAGITDACVRDSDELHMVVVLLTGLAMYNGCELAITVFLTFKRYRGLYFWSLLISSIGVVIYGIGFLLMFIDIMRGNMRFLATTINAIGWWPMVTGQSLVLWSRLHLILHGEQGDRILKYTKWMIIIDAILLHPSTTILSFGSNGSVSTQAFIRGYGIMEKIQMAGFFCQEVVLSTIYIVQTRKILHGSCRQRNTRRTMMQLILINILIIILDVGLLGLEAASLYILQTLIKGVVYSIKLKLEFGILSTIVDISGGSSASRVEDNLALDFIQMDANPDTNCCAATDAVIISSGASEAWTPKSYNPRSAGRRASQSKVTGSSVDLETALLIEDCARPRRIDYASLELHIQKDRT